MFEKFWKLIYDHREAPGTQKKEKAEIIEAHIRTLLSKERAEGYEEGQKNPMVGFLRQYLNERPGLSDERLWTDEDILRFLRIPFTTLPADSTEGV